MHLHSSGCSKCASSTAEELIYAAKNKGYSGVVFTNHFYRGNTCIDRELPWESFVSAYEEDYIRAKELGEQIDIDVFFGIEEGIGGGKEMLIYGLTPEIIKSNPNFKSMQLPELYKFIHKNGGFAVAAHPFRQAFYIPEPDKEPDLRYFDAIEVNNHSTPSDRNIKAAIFAQETGILTTSGGDVHNTSGIGFSGIAFNNRIKTSKELVRLLKSGKYRLIVNGQII